MAIADVMTTDLPTVGPGECLRDTAAKMKLRGAKALPVCDREELVGIITDWDLTVAIADDRSPSQTQVSECMSSDIVSATPRTTFPEALRLMGERRIHHLLVRDGDRFAGMVHVDVEWEELDGAVQAPMATFTARI